MISDDRPLAHEATALSEKDTALAELVDDAVKALSIGGAFGTDGEVRRAVDRLRRLEAEESEL